MESQRPGMSANRPQHKSLLWSCHRIVSREQTRSINRRRAHEHQRPESKTRLAAHMARIKSVRSIRETTETRTADLLRHRRDRIHIDRSRYAPRTKNTSVTLPRQKSLASYCGRRVAPLSQIARACWSLSAMARFGFGI